MSPYEQRYYISSHKDNDAAFIANAIRNPLACRE